jgi:pimeloyl-ACP methyl ester carboxylesterase
VGARVLAHQRHGDGPAAFLLLHGFLGSARNLGGLARRLAAADRGRSVVALDLTGHGASPELPAGADLATLAGDVLATSRALDLRAPLSVVGHSLGGRIALRAAALSPERIAHVALLDIGPSPIPVNAETARAVSLLIQAPPRATREGFRTHFRAGGLADPIIEWLLTNLVAADGQHRWSIDRAALAALHARTSAEDLWPVAEAPRPWTLACIRGGRSGYVSDIDVPRLVAAGSRVITVEGAGHFLHVERPAEVLAALHEGLGACPSTPPAG